MDKTILNNVHGLSCVENYYLGILQAQGMNVSCLYSESYLEFNQILTDFIVKDEKYESYEKIERLHSLSEQKGLIQIAHYMDPIDTLIANIKSGNKNDIFIIKIKQEFLNEIFKMKTWRDDHYILTFVKNSDIYYINDVPKSDGLFENEDLIRFYDQEYIKITLLRSLNQIEIEQCLLNFLHKVNDSYSIHIDFKKIEIGLEDIIKIRDVFGVYRIMLKRMNEYLDEYMNTDIIINQIKACDKYYTILEYYNLRKKFDKKTIQDMIETVRREDKLIKNYILGHQLEKVIS